MKKQGFTLQEILVTIGIIGVVAALTIPGVMKSNQDRVTGINLSSTVQSLESAFSIMIAKENANTLYDTAAWSNGGINATSSKANKNSFIDNLAKYLAFAGYKDENTAVKSFYGSNKVYALSGNGSQVDNNAINQFSDCIPIMMKNGAVVFIRTFAKAPALGMGGGYTYDENTGYTRNTALNGNPADIFIDTNGANKPNTVGRDLFHFYVGSEGKLFPYGGKDIAAFENHVGSDWKNGATYRCTDTVKDNNGWGCTARFIDENYKMNY